MGGLSAVGYGYSNIVSALGREERRIKGNQPAIEVAEWILNLFIYECFLL